MFNINHRFGEWRMADGTLTLRQLEALPWGAASTLRAVLDALGGGQSCPPLLADLPRQKGGREHSGVMEDGAENQLRQSWQ